MAGIGKQAQGPVARVAALTGLIQEVIERKKVKQRRLQAMESILELRARQAPVNGAEIAKAKQEIRS